MTSGRVIGGRRQEIVEATLGLLATTTLDGLSTRQIARVLGVSQPALFRHFRSRDDLLVAVVTHARGHIEGVVQAVLVSGRPAIEQLRAVARGVLAQVERTPGLPRLLFADAASGDSGVRTALRHLVTLQTSLATELFREAQREGTARLDLDVRAAGMAFVAVIQGAVLQWQVLGSEGEPWTVAEPLLDLLLRAVAVPGPGPEPRAHPGPAVAEPRPGTGLEILDVRPLLSRGIDPLEAILEAVGAAGHGGLVALSVPFRPAPLIGLLTARGHRVVDRAGPGGAWEVDIVVGGTPAILELTDLEPPQPLERLLEEATKLGPGTPLIARLPRFPRMLLPHLERRGLSWRIHEAADGTALIRVVKDP